MGALESHFLLRGFIITDQFVPTTVSKKGQVIDRLFAKPIGTTLVTAIPPMKGIPSDFILVTFWAKDIYFGFVVYVLPGDPGIAISRKRSLNEGLRG
jgi:hypothetical protein